jgi:Papain family cysteine protease
MDNAFKFDEKSGGLCSEEDYPYKAKQGKCMTNCTDVPGSIVKTFVDVPPGKVEALVAAITLQPISVAIQANQVRSHSTGRLDGFSMFPPSTHHPLIVHCQFVFQFYKTGVITDDSCGERGDIDHGVLGKLKQYAHSKLSNLF